MPNTISKKIADFVLKQRWAILITNAIIMGLLLFAMANRISIFSEHSEYMKEISKNPLKKDKNHVNPPPIFDADYKIFFDKGNPELVAYENLQENYVKDENLIIVVKSNSGDLFTNENLNSLKQITDQSWAVPYVSRVDGITNFNYTFAEDDDLVVEDFIDDLPLTDSLL